MLIEIQDCIYDEIQLKKSHGFDGLDKIGKESFVNHIHFEGSDNRGTAQSKINEWKEEMLKKWPNKSFRIYRDEQESETILRFHEVRPELPNWCDSGVEIMEINPDKASERNAEHAPQAQHPSS
ncbi:hypothetical protein [Cerasicoccus fimbriatus]|uniref:hypothetical protein n=1 Tax=Cerasicoccus fimbriatus TaxID=3014554 RepID=UPI0022B5D448|nr:hypothetical protein [Cerasicoccus sp. TK19100]